MTEVSPPVAPAGTVVEALATAVAAADLESVTRPLLDALNRVTGLESTYLTSVDPDADLQRIVYALNTSPDFTIPEGLEVDWCDTLCQRALSSGQVYTDDVPDVWGDSDAAAALGIQTYASAPVVLPDGRMYGTLCGASSERRSADTRTLELFQVFSRVIADAIGRQQQLEVAQEQAAWALEQLRSRSRFLATAEHELKTPVAIIQGWSQMLLERRTEDQEGVDQAVRSIHTQARNLSTRLHEMLEHARAEVIVSELSPTSVDLAAFVEDIARGLDGLSLDHQVETVVRQPATATADPRALEIVVEHLVENAVKHTPPGRITCTVDRRDDRTLLIVEDEGPGFPEDVDVFEAFSRGRTDTAGSGLGLNIVRTLVRSMSGEVSIADRPSGGAAVTVALPMARG